MAAHTMSLLAAGPYSVAIMYGGAVASARISSAKNAVVLPTWQIIETTSIDAAARKCNFAHG